jgi:hypothetical protein
MIMTVAEIRAQVEAAKAQAAVNFDRNHGDGAYNRLAAYSASDANRRALENVCAKAPRKGK